MNECKLKEAILYLSYLANKSPKKLGKTRLYKILWWFEGILYIRNGKKPVDLNFVKNKYGPVAKDIDSILQNLKEDGLILFDRNGDGHWIIKSLSPPRFEELSKEEIELLSKLYMLLSSMRARDISEISHTTYWKKLNYGDEMNPIFVLENFVEIRKPTDDEMIEVKRMYEACKNGTLVEEIKKELATLS